MSNKDAASRVCPHGVDLTQACYCQRCDDEDGTTDAVAAMASIGRDAISSEQFERAYAERSGITVE